MTVTIDHSTESNIPDLKLWHCNSHYL